MNYQEAKDHLMNNSIVDMGEPELNLMHSQLNAEKKSKESERGESLALIEALDLLSTKVFNITYIKKILQKHSDAEGFIFVIKGARSYCQFEGDENEKLFISTSPEDSFKYLLTSSPRLKTGDSYS